MRLNKDNLVNSSWIFGIVIFACIVIILILKNFYGSKIDISFMKDIISIGATFIASLVAIILFNDWKSQHNKQVINNFGIQVYDLFIDTEKNIAILRTHLDDLENLINEYEWEYYISNLKKDGHQIYLTNVTTTIRAIQISFKSLYTKFQSYSIVNNTLDIDFYRYSYYLDKFNDLNGLDNEIFLLRDNINDWQDDLFDLISLFDDIRQKEILPILENLKVN